MVSSTLDPVELMGWLPLSFSISLAILLYFLIKSKSNKNSHKLPPRPPTLPFIGNLYQLGMPPHQSFYHLSRKYGPIMLLKLGSIPTLVISSPEMAKQILKIHDVDFFTRPELFSIKKLNYNHLDVAFSPYSDMWSQRRKIFVSHFLNPKIIKSLWNAKRRLAISQMIKSLSSQQSCGTINFDENMFQLVGELVTSIAIGGSKKGYHLKDEEVKGFYDEYMRMMQSFSAVDFSPSIGQIIDTLSGHRYRLNKSFAKLDAFFEMVIKDHIHEKIDQEEDLVDILIRLSNDHSRSNLTINHIKALLMNVFIGGVDTSAVTIVWAMTELMRNSRVMKKAQEEIRSSVHMKAQLHEEDVANLKYLKMGLKETFRLHPPSPLLLPHECTNYTKIQGDIDYEIRIKIRVFINAWAIGRDTEYWTNPNEFYPERYEGTDIDFRGADFQLLPFGSGRRICPALSAATMTIKVTLANLLHLFNWELPDGMRADDVSLEEGGLTLHRKSPLMLKPVKFN